MEEECDSAPLKATNLVIQLFPDADSSLRHSAGRSALTQTHKQHTKAKAPQMTSKPLSGTTLKGVRVGELITDAYVLCWRVLYTHAKTTLEILRAALCACLTAK